MTGRRSTTTSELLGGAETIAEVKHIHQVDSQFSQKRLSRATLPPLNSIEMDQRLRRWSHPRRRLLGRDSSPSWEHSLRRSNGAAPRPRIKFTQRKSLPTPVLQERSTNHSRMEEKRRSDPFPEIAPSFQEEGQLETTAPDFVNYSLRSKRSLEEREKAELERAKLNAIVTLTAAFLPLWRRYILLKKKRAARVIESHWKKKINGREVERKNRAADTIGYFFLNPLSHILLSMGKLVGRVERIQRCYRQHRLRVEACVALNLAVIRRQEPMYWERVVMTRESELINGPSHLPTKKEHKMVDSPIGGKTAPNPPTTTTRASRKESRGLELDVSNYYLAGPLPQSIVESELRNATYSFLLRSAKNALFLDRIGVGKSTTKTKRAKRTICCTHPVFLPPPTLTRVIDNACYLTSLLRDDPTLRAHLVHRDQQIQPY